MTTQLLPKHADFGTNMHDDFITISMQYVVIFRNSKLGVTGLS